MGSNAKKKTTMSKLNREHKLREKRQDKAMRKEERRRAAANGETPSWELPDEEPTAAEAAA